MKTLCLVRHGETEWHADERVAGRSDVALSANGQAEARAAGRYLSQLIEHTHDRYALQSARWFSSTAIRTRTSASLMLESFQSTQKVTADERLVELDFGDWEGQRWPDIHQNEADVLSAWGEDWVNRSPPNGETFAQQRDRCCAWFDDWESESADNASAIVVIHGGSIRALTCHLVGWSLADAMNYSVDTAGITLLGKDTGATDWRIRMLNAKAFIER